MCYYIKYVYAHVKVKPLVLAVEQKILVPLYLCNYTTSYSYCSVISNQ